MKQSYEKDSLSQDNSPNKLASASYELYRYILNEDSGMDLIGIGDEEIYQRVIQSPDTVFKVVNTDEGDLSVPMATTNQVLEFFNPIDIPNDAIMIILPEKQLTQEEIEHLKNKYTLLIPKQKILRDDFTEKCLKKVRNIEREELEVELTNGINGELMPKCGFVGFIGINQYDISQCTDMQKTELPKEIEFRDTVSTMSVDIIKSKLPELIDLHKVVFGQLTDELGYYDGTTGDDIIETIESGMFTPIATFNKNTGEALSFALFASNLLDLQDLGWLNADSVEKTIREMSKTHQPILSIPHTIVSKGAGLFPLITKIAARATINGTAATELFTITKTSLHSINSTPAIMYRSLQQIGFRPQGSVIEATFLTKF